MNIWVFDLIRLGIFELSMSVFSAFLYVLIPHLTKNYLFLAKLFVVAAGAVLLIIMLGMKTQLITLVWAGIFPIVAFYLLGTRRGMTMHILFFSILFVALYFDWHNGLYVADRIILANVVTVGISLGFLVYMYEQTRADAIGLAIQSSLTDMLTHTGNRKMFALMLENEKTAVQKNDTPLSIIMIDLDHFKSVNDRFGHLSGDNVLKELTQRLQQFIGHHSMIFRWGGEEFLILLPNTALEDAVKLAEKLRKSIETDPFGPVGNLTASFSVTAVDPHETESETILRLDKALFQAKEEGRNRVITA